MDVVTLQSAKADAAKKYARPLPAVDLIALPGALKNTYGFNAGTSVQNVLTVGNVQYAVWWNAAGAPIVGKRTLGFLGVSAWTTYDLTNVAGNPLQAPVADNGHNFLSIGIDSTGCLHVSGNMHNITLKYVRQTVAGDITQWTAGTMTGSNENSVTYPYFLMLPDGTLDFLYRNGTSGQGDYFRNRYNPTTKTWSQLGKIFDGLISNESAYLNTPVIHPDGDVSFFFVWRSGGLADTNADLGYARFAKDNTAKKASGAAQTVPVTHANCELILDTAAFGSGLINQQGASIDSAGRVHASQWIYDANGKSQWLHAYRDLDANAWVVETVTALDVRINLAVSIPSPEMSRTACVSDQSGRTWIIGRINYNGLSGAVRAVEVTPGKPHTATTLAGLELYDWEPSVDTYAMRTRGELSMVVTPLKSNGVSSSDFGDASQWSTQWGAILTVQLAQLPSIGAAPSMRQRGASPAVAGTVDSASQATLSSAPQLLVDSDWATKMTLVRLRAVASLSAAGTGTLVVTATSPLGAVTNLATIPVTATTPGAVRSAWVPVGNVPEGSILSVQGSSGVGGTTLTMTAGTLEVSQVALGDGGALPRLVDSQAPSAPATPTAVAGALQVTVTTAGATDNVAVTGYQWYRNGVTLVGTTAGLTFTDTGRTAGTPLFYTVRAVDAAGNVSVASANSNTATPTNAASITDDFSGGDAATIQGRVTPVGSATWAVQSATGLNGGVQILGGVAKASSASSNPGFALVATGTVKMLAQATIAAILGTTNTKVWVFANAQDTNNYYAIRSNGTSSYVFQRTIAGTVTQLSAFGTTPAVGDVLAIRTTDTQVEFYINGTLRYNTTIDATLATYQKAGIGFQFGADPTTALDNFSVTPQL